MFRSVKLSDSQTNTFQFFVNSFTNYIENNGFPGVKVQSIYSGTMPHYRYVTNCYVMPLAPVPYQIGVKIVFSFFEHDFELNKKTFYKAMVHVIIKHNAKFRNNPWPNYFFWFSNHSIRHRISRNIYITPFQVGYVLNWLRNYFKSEKGQTSNTVIKLDNGINYIFSDAKPKKSLWFSIDLSNDFEMNKDKNIERGQVYKSNIGPLI